MKYLLEKETHNKNEDNTLKELNKIFLIRTLYEKLSESYVGRPPPPERLID